MTTEHKEVIDEIAAFEKSLKNLDLEENKGKFDGDILQSTDYLKTIRVSNWNWNYISW